MFTPEDMLVFINATKELPREIKERIWKEVNGTAKIKEYPRCPRKEEGRIERRMVAWNNRKKLSGNKY
tara:strand:+ start:1113 stop:1316 length:204 start_codon:yes stop_codon:yes gene_type:complete